MEQGYAAGGRSRSASGPSGEDGDGVYEDESLFTDAELAEEAAIQRAAELRRADEELAMLNELYQQRFGFRYVIFVAGRPRDEIVPLLERALVNDREVELRRAVDDAIYIAGIGCAGCAAWAPRSERERLMQYEIHYGKADVKVYRTYGTPLGGHLPIPESPFTGRPNTLMAAEIEVVVGGEAFLDAYTRGDNRLVVATDTMKNFIHAASQDCPAATLEGWLHHVGSRFLAEYPHMERLTMIGRELPFPAALVPAESDGWAESEVLFARDRNDRSTASLELERDGGGGVIVTGHACGRSDLQLIKITGSAFADFARRAHHPAGAARPAALHLDRHRLALCRCLDALGADPARYVDGQQVADLAAAVFHQFVSLSIQHLVHEIGLRMLERWPQLDEVSFEATNRLWDPGGRQRDGRADQDLRRSAAALRADRPRHAVGERHPPHPGGRAAVPLLVDRPRRDGDHEPAVGHRPERGDRRAGADARRGCWTWAAARPKPCAGSWSATTCTAWASTCRPSRSRRRAPPRWSCARARWS